MNSIPSEYWDYDYPDMSKRNHPAHPEYNEWRKELAGTGSIPGPSNTAA